MTWWTNKTKFFKFTIAILLGTTMLLSFAIYFIASKGATKMEFPAKANILKTTVDLVTKKRIIDTQSVSILGSIPKGIDQHSYNTQLLASLMIFSVISIPLVLVQLTLGSHKNDVVSLTVNLISAIIFLVLFGLMVAALTELSALNIEMKSSAKIYAGLKDTALEVKNKSVQETNAIATKANSGNIVTFTWA